MPGQFIPIPEKSKQILNIDRWAIKRSIELLSRDPRLPLLTVNTSGRTFLMNRTLPQFIHNQLSERNVSARYPSG
jgi:EAL domain-containing protein (putative c-di-GMP-specific phosphodiesterase class I)